MNQIYGQMAFSCEHCGQKYNLFQFNLAVFIRGLVVLIGKGHFYAGINCINGKCCKLILNRAEIGLLDPFRDMMTYPQQTIQEFIPSLTYHAQLQFFLERYLPISKGAEILSYSLNNDSELDPRLTDMEAELGDKYFHAHIHGWKEVCGPRVNLYYLTEEAIEYIAGLENNQGLRILPRYIHYNSLTSTIESFVWDYYFSLEEAKKYGYTGTNQNHSISFKGKHQSIADFIDILIDNPLAPYGYGDDPGAFEGIWKKSFPFNRHGIPESLDEIFKLTPVKDSYYDQLARSVEKAHRDKRFHDYLEEAKQPFIDEYLAGVIESDWCYAKVWGLKEKYLIQALSKVGRSSTLDMIKCRKIAEVLWDIDQSITIKDMKERPEIQVIGQSYGDRTIHKWICEVAPEKHRKPGRPRKK